MTTEYHDARGVPGLAILASVAPMQSSRFLPGSVLVQVQPEARCGRGRWVRRFVPDEVQAGSNPAVRSTVCPRSTKVVSQPRKPRASVRFRPRARYESHRRCARSSAGERRRDMPEIAGSIPAARTRSCSSSRPGSRALNPETRVRLPYTTPSQDSVVQWTQDLRFRISGWRFESARSHAGVTIDRLRSGIGLVSKSDQRGSTPRRPASMASSSPGGEAGFIRRTCRVRSPGLLPGSVGTAARAVA